MGAFAIADIELVEPVAVEHGEPADECRLVFLQVRLDGPVLLRFEGLALSFTLHHETQGGALDAAGTQAGLDLAPQQWRQVVADQVIQGPPCLLCVDQVHGEFPRVVHGVLNRFLGNFRELDAVQLLVLYQALLAQYLVDVPGNRLAFAVEVRREVDRVGLLRRLDDGVDVLLAVLGQLVVHFEPVVRVHRAFLAGQVANMAIGRQDDEIVAEIAIDGGRLGGRLHDEQVFGHGAPSA